MRDDHETETKTDERRHVEFEITSKRWGSDPSSSVKVIEVPIIGESKARLDITLDLRKTDTIIIRPIRRDVDDVSGLIEDAERLANS
ncbi:MAG: hypothetical protein AB7L09_01240 [Nitrospira sp.]